MNAHTFCLLAGFSDANTKMYRCMYLLIHYINNIDA